MTRLRTDLKVLDAHVSEGPSHERYCPVSVKDLYTLKDNRWLNDAVINLQLELLNDIAHESMNAYEEEVPRVNFFSTVPLCMATAKWQSENEKSLKQNGPGLLSQTMIYYEYDRV